VASGRSGVRLAACLYRWTLRLLPPPVYAEDGREMAETFAVLWEDARSTGRRAGTAFRSFGRFPWVAALEWGEFLGLIRAPGWSPDEWRWGMSSWAGNLRLALRTLRKAPAFTVTTIILLGLGIGSVTTIFTLVDHALLRALPYPAAERLIVVENGSHPGPVFQEFQTMKSVDLWGAAWSETANLVGEGDPLRITEIRVSQDFFALFGARPAFGRLLIRDDFQAADVVVLGQGIWKRAFGADPDIVGKVIRLDGTPLSVVGVLDPAFLPPEGLAAGGASPDIWRPLDWSDEGLNRISSWVLDVMGRMAPGATVEDVNAELVRASENLAKRFPEDRMDRDGNPYELPAAHLQEVTTRRVRTGLGLLLGAVGLLLLVACLNVAHLFLARSLGRVQDMAVRRALGAGTGTLVQQLMVESLVLGGVGGLVGLGLASLGLRSFLALNPSAIPWASDISLDMRTLIFAATVSVATALLFGLLPALRSMGHDLTYDLKGTSRGATSGQRAYRFRSGLVVAEVALSLVLVAEAGLLLKSFMKLQALDPGFRVAGVWTIPLSPTGFESPEEYVRAMDEVEASLARVPGVTGATYSLTLPFEVTGTGRCCWMTSNLLVEGELREGMRLFLQPVTGSYFETLGVSLAAGRVWSESEAGSEPWPTVLSESLALELFGSAELAINQVLEVGGEESPVIVVGVAEDTRHFGLDQEFVSFLYLPMEKLPFTIPMAHMAVSIPRAAPAGWTRILREAVWDAAPEMPVPTVRAMEEWVDRSTADRRFDGVLFGSFGALALILAAAGLYGTLLYAVGQRRREMGIRLALGAARNRVMRQVVAKGLLLAALGCILGLGGAWGVGRFLESRLFEMEATDPGTLLGAVAVLLAAAALASWFPARRASRVDPMHVLREE
jgi:putative ABC transport system permease protein